MATPADINLKSKQSDPAVVRLLTDLLERSAEEKRKRDEELASGQDTRS